MSFDSFLVIYLIPFTSASSVESDNAEPSKQLDGRSSSPQTQSHSPRPSNIPPKPQDEKVKEDVDIIHQLLRNPTLYDPMRKPRYPIVLCHGAMPLRMRITFVFSVGAYPKVYMGSMYVDRLLFQP